MKFGIGGLALFSKAPLDGTIDVAPPEAVKN
jgi:hypothetical protein